MPPTPLTELIQTFAHARRVIREKKDQAWQKECGSKTTSQSVKMYQELKIRPTTNAKSMPEMNLNREVLGWLIAARTGHRHFADYPERFEHEEVDIRPETVRAVNSSVDYQSTISLTNSS